MNKYVNVEVQQHLPSTYDTIYHYQEVQHKTSPQC